MATTVVHGLSPDGGVRQITVSPGGDNQLTPVTVDPLTRVLSFVSPNLTGAGKLRLQWRGVEGAAYTALIAIVLPEDALVEVDVPGWSPATGPTFFLAAPQNTAVTVIAQRGRASG